MAYERTPKGENFVFRELCEQFELSVSVYDAENEKGEPEERFVVFFAKDGKPVALSDTVRGIVRSHLHGREVIGHVAGTEYPPLQVDLGTVDVYEVLGSKSPMLKCIGNTQIAAGQSSVYFDGWLNSSVEDRSRAATRKRAVVIPANAGATEVPFPAEDFINIS